MKNTSINIDSRAWRVPFPLQEEVIILAFNGRTRLSAEAEQEKKGGSFLRDILKNLWFKAWKNMDSASKFL